MRRSRRGLPFAGLGEVLDRPCVMVDGAPTPSTVLTLSHWPGSPTPAPLRHDLSAGIAFRWLRSRRRWARPEPELVCTDHFDQDGLVSAFVLSHPDAAAGLEGELMAVARAGDFALGTSRAALRACFALSALAESWPARPGDNPSLGGDLHREGLVRLPEMLARPERWRRDWEEEDAFLSRSETRLSDGRVTLEEVGPADLAVVHVADAIRGPASQLGRRRPAAVHPVAVHNRTGCSRILVLAPPHYELYFRYETWVQLASTPWSRRRDMSGTARELTAAEGGGAQWAFNGIGATIARLSVGNGGESALDPQVVRRLVIGGLRGAAAG